MDNNILDITIVEYTSEMSEDSSCVCGCGSGSCFDGSGD